MLATRPFSCHGSCTYRGHIMWPSVSVPAFWTLRLVNGVFFLEAIWTELVLRGPLHTYEKGH